MLALFCLYNVHWTCCRKYIWLWVFFLLSSHTTYFRHMLTALSTCLWIFLEIINVFVDMETQKQFQSNQYVVMLCRCYAKCFRCKNKWDEGIHKWLSDPKTLFIMWTGGWNVPRTNLYTCEHGLSLFTVIIYQSFWANQSSKVYLRAAACKDKSSTKGKKTLARLEGQRTVSARRVCYWKRSTSLVCDPASLSSGSRML